MEIIVIVVITILSVDSKFSNISLFPYIFTIFVVSKLFLANFWTLYFFSLSLNSVPLIEHLFRYNQPKTKLELYFTLSFSISLFFICLCYDLLVKTNKKTILNQKQNQITRYPKMLLIRIA